MKQIKKYILSLLLVFATIVSFAQMTGPEDPGGDPEQGGDPPLGASIGGGLLFLITAGIAYGGNKVYLLIRESKEQTES